MGHGRDDVARRRQKKLERRKRRENKKRQIPPIAKLSHKVTERLEDAHELVRNGTHAEAEPLMHELVITSEPKRLASSPRVQELVTDGNSALNAGDYDFAEALFHEAIEQEPDYCLAVYNLCTIWLRRDGAQGMEKARKRLEQLYHDFPDYPFAYIALAQFAAMDGDLKKARDLLAPVYHAKQLHIAEAKALFAAEAQIALEERDIEGAKRAFDLFRRLADDGDANLEILSRQIDIASKKRGLRRLLSRFQRPLKVLSRTA